MFFCSNITSRSLQRSTLFVSYISVLSSHLFFFFMPAVTSTSIQLWAEHVLHLSLISKCTKLRMFFISVFCLHQRSLRVGRRPAGPQAQVANIWRHCGSSWRCLQSAFWKPEQEKAARKAKLMGTWQAAGYEAEARYWKWQLSRDVTLKESRRGPTRPPSPTPCTVWRLCHMR